MGPDSFIVPEAERQDTLQEEVLPRSPGEVRPGEVHPEEEHRLAEDSSPEVGHLKAVRNLQKEEYADHDLPRGEFGPGGGAPAGGNEGVLDTREVGTIKRRTGRTRRRLGRGRSTARTARSGSVARRRSYYSWGRCGDDCARHDGCGTRLHHDGSRNGRRRDISHAHGHRRIHAIRRSAGNIIDASYNQGSGRKEAQKGNKNKGAPVTALFKLNQKSS